MIAPRTLAQRLEGARLAALAPAIVATLKPLYPGVTVKELPGRIDISDILAGDVYAAPMIGICLTRIRQPISVDGSFELPTDITAIIVTEDQAIGSKAVERAELAYAIGLGLFEVLVDLDVARWGLASITSPTDAEMRPLVTAKSYTAGTAYYALTWRQSLIGFGEDPLARPPVETVETVLDGEAVALPADLSGWPV
ncbi:hypothetical protein [Ancylobacter sp. G4_0304]|uniref:hypothetical protein n=1 Tax=Ancylobacter sp. G4_0304 TaxID=3114289 RepID=UPI0039C5C1A1